jgi:hypothetical protein
MREKLGTFIFLLLLVAIAIQFIPVTMENPEVTGTIEVLSEVEQILRRACFDCHSNERVWPWYSDIAPISWLIAYDVIKGRKELNFSTWTKYPSSRQAKLIHESWKEVKEGEMPPWFYILLHPEARLSSADRATLREWASRSGSAEEDEDDD